MLCLLEITLSVVHSLARLAFLPVMAQGRFNGHL